MGAHPGPQSLVFPDVRRRSVVTASFPATERWFAMTETIVAAISRFFTPELIGKLAAASGLDGKLAHEGVAAAVPAILTGLAGVAEKPDGARQLASAMAQQSPDMLRSLTGGLADLTPQLAESGSGMLSTLLGGAALPMLTSTLSRFLGVSDASARTLIAMVTPMIMGALGRAQAAQGLDAAGLARTLAQQKDAIAGAMPPGLANLLETSGLYAAANRAPSSPHVASFPSAPAMARASVDPQASATRWPLWTLAALVALGALLWYGWERTPTPAPTAMAPAAPTSVAFLAKTPEGWVAVRDNVYVNTDVYTPAGEKIGAIKYVLNAPNGNSQAAVIGVARVLGIGEKDICVPVSAFKRVPQGSENRIVLDISKDGLLAVPPFQQ
jgi:uncharacterized protein DUF937/PRC-barrel domain protein